jgi:2-amino-4-hydroxy-6-hydroxymethyldihydropteridine diphosphokinase
LSGPNSRVFLSLGGNLGDPVQSMAAALHLLDEDAETRVVTVSSLYRTPPWGKTDQPDFLNIAAELSTALSPHVLLEFCLDIERRLKRVREERWGPRLIDIDILVFGTRAIHETELAVPHPRMLERAFVMVPLAEIAPDLVLADKTVTERLAGMDVSGIERLPSGRDWWQA